MLCSTGVRAGMDCAMCTPSTRPSSPRWPQRAPLACRRPSVPMGKAESWVSIRSGPCCRRRIFDLQVSCNPAKICKTYVLNHPRIQVPMSENIFQRIQRSVREKHRQVEDWLETAPESELDCCLASENSRPVQEHLQVLENVLGKAEDQTLGICQVCHGQVEDRVLEIDYTTSVCLDCLSETERRNLETELEFSSEVQRALLPQQVPSIPGLDIAAFSRPAQIVGGDYFDFIQFRNGTYGLVIADVMGHGVSASLLMSSLQTALHTLIPDNDSASEVIQRVNRYYLHNVNLTTFVTAFLGQFDPVRGVLAYCNAGHNPPLFYRAQPDGGDRSHQPPRGGVRPGAPGRAAGPKYGPVLRGFGVRLTPGVEGFHWGGGPGG